MEDFVLMETHARGNNLHVDRIKRASLDFSIRKAHREISQTFGLQLQSIGKFGNNSCNHLTNVLL